MVIGVCVCALCCQLLSASVLHCDAVPVHGDVLSLVCGEVSMIAAGTGCAQFLCPQGSFTNDNQQHWQQQGVCGSLQGVQHHCS